MRPLLVLVDLQEDFLAEPGLQPHRDRIVAGAAELLAVARASGWAIVHVHTSIDPPGDRRMDHWKRAGRTACVVGTAGHAPPEAVRPTAGEPILHKTGFRVERDALLDHARATDADIAIVAGIHAHACVREAGIELYQGGLAVRIARDAVGSHEPVHAAQTELYFARRSMPFVGTGELLRQVARPTVEPQQRPVFAEPLVGTATLSADERIAALDRAAELVEAAADDLVATMVDEVGKPVRYARGEVARTASLLRTVAKRVESQQLEREEPEALVRRRPLGRVAVITPWNNPFAIAAGQLAPALAYGNAVLWKPAPAGRRCAERLHDLLRAAGFNDRVLERLDGDAAAGIALIRRADIDGVCFTGATATGRLVAAQCAERSIPLQAELGGNNGAIVTAAADLQRAANLIAEAAFGCAGQRCTATRRAIVADAVHEPFVRALAASTARLSWGDPWSHDTQVGPLLDPQQAARISGIVARARAAGHAVLQPHLDRADVPGREGSAYHPPTIILCDDPAAEVVQEESFGPILVVQRAADWQQSVALQNGVRQGLAAALFSASPEEAGSFLAGAQAGILKLNQATVEAGVDVPFVGWKESGFGPPQHGDGNLEFFTRAQAVYGSLP